MAGLVTCQLLTWLTWLCLVAALNITPDRISSLVGAHDTVLITFCSPYGHHCKQFLPDLDSAQQLLDQNYPNHDVILAHVDCVQFSDYCSGQGIRSYPTLRVYKGNATSFEAFQGRRQRYELVSYLIDGAWPTTPAADVLPTSSSTATPSASIDNNVFLKKDGSEADVKLELPGLPINLPTVRQDLQASSSVVLQFNFTDDGKHVMLNGEVLALQVPNPSVPALVTARQVPLDYDIRDLHLTPMHSRWAHGEFKAVGVDYEIYGRNRDDPNIYYYNYHPEIVINLIGCSPPDPPSYQSDFLLDSLDQQVIKIKFHDVQGNGQSGDPNRSYRIESITLHARSQESGYRHRVNHHSFEPYRVPKPDDRHCSRWSWRCADIGDPPWYRFIWRQNFDEFGRIGSLRWRSMRWYAFIVKPVLGTVMPPVWIWFPLTVLALYFRLVRPLSQRMAGQRGEEETRSKE